MRSGFARIDDDNDCTWNGNNGFKLNKMTEEVQGKAGGTQIKSYWEQWEILSMT